MQTGTDHRRPRGWAVTSLVTIIGLLLGVAGYALWQRQRATGAPEPSVEAFAAPGKVFDQSLAPSRLQAPDQPAVEPTSARAALQEFLSAEASGDAARAFPLLDRSTRARVSSVEAWAIGRNDRLVPTSFEIMKEEREGGSSTFAVDTTHEPALDAFRGYVPARARQRWAVREEDGHWRVAGRPVDIEPVLPSTDGTPGVVQRWVDAKSACDSAAAEPLQRTSFLYGPRFLLEAPCTDRGTWSAGAVQRLSQVPESTVVTSAFGPDSGVWARAVPVKGPRTSFFAVVAAFGDDWRVVALVPGDAPRT